MAVPMIEITGIVYRSNGELFGNGEIKLKLIIPYGKGNATVDDDTSANSYIVSTSVINAITDANGNVQNEQGETLTIIPNSLISPINTYYSVCIIDGSNIENITRWVTGNQNYQIGDIPYG